MSKFKFKFIKKYFLQKKREFFKEAVKDIRNSGTIAPSSKYLIDKMLNNIDFTKNNVIVEYGAGNGRITNELLKRLNNNSVLICFEINTKFYKHLLTFKDKRLVVINESSENIKKVCNEMNLNDVHHFVSSLPLTNMPDSVSEKIVIESYALLKENGYFLQYQYSLTYLKKFKDIFLNRVILNFELRNIPPAFIYKCKK